MLFLFTLVSVLHEGSAYCPPGHVLHLFPDGQKCEPCDNDTFNPFDNAIHCDWCTHVDRWDPYVEEIEPCTSTKDAVIKCRNPQHFYDETEKDCKFCTVCENMGQFEVRSCSRATDTVCCPELDMDLRDGVCIKGQFCSVKEKLVHRGNPDGLHDSCEPCLLNRTNYEVSHVKTDCEDVCFEHGNISMKVVERKFRCEHREITLGENCHKRGVFLCAPMLIKYTWTSKPKTSMTKERNTPATLPFGAAVVIVLLIAILYRFRNGIVNLLCRRG